MLTDFYHKIVKVIVQQLEKNSKQMNIEKLSVKTNNWLDRSTTESVGCFFWF